MPLLSLMLTVLIAIHFAVALIFLGAMLVFAKRVG